MKAYHIEMDGLGCAHCALRVEEGLRAMGAQVDARTCSGLTVHFDGPCARLRETVEMLGFDVNGITEA